MPRDADVDFGAGDSATSSMMSFDQDHELGDIAFGCYHPVPPARSEHASKPNGTVVKVEVYDPEEGTFRRMPGRHWGAGIVLLDRDHQMIKPLLLEIFEGKQCLSTFKLLKLLNGFWGNIIKWTAFLK